MSVCSFSEVKLYTRVKVLKEVQLLTPNDH